MAGAVLEEPPERSLGGARKSAVKAGRVARWAMGLLIAGLVFGVPVVYYRYSYTHSKRLREVCAGKLYRSGAMTAAGFREAALRYGIRTIINLQDESPDPAVPHGFFDRRTERESELCRELNVHYKFLNPDLVHPYDFPAQRPAAIDAGHLAGKHRSQGADRYRHLGSL